MKFLTPNNISLALSGMALLSVLWCVRKIAKGGLPIAAPATSKDKSAAILWALTTFKFFSGNAKVWILAFIGSTAAVKWGDLSGFERFSIILAASGQALTHAEAFFDQTAAKLASGKPPIGTNGTDNTKHFVKEQVEAPKP